jgi:16S rRNA (uracil1498-N3)-methyltransferase
MADRYYVDTPIAGATAQLTGPEAHHVAHVMRAKPGAQVTLFDGSGAEFAATIERVGRAEIDLQVTAREEVDRELAVAITLGVALPKGDRQRWLVEKATELGVARIVPLVTERSNDRESPSALEKLRRAVIEASKQCGRNRLLEIKTPQPVLEFLRDDGLPKTRWLAHPGGTKLAEPPSEAGVQAHPEAIALAVGPEGGFTPAELDAARTADWQLVDLGTRILRVETAALTLAAILARSASERE